MPRFVEAMRQVARVSGRPTGPWWRGLALRVVERLCATVPFFVGAVWLDNALTAGAAPLPLGPLVLALALLLVVQLLCSRFGQLACFLGAYDLMIGYRERVIDHVGRLPLGFLQRQRVGQLAAVITEDVKRVEDIFTHVGADLAAAAVVPLLFLAGLAWIDGRLALALVATLPLALLALNAASRFFLVRGRAKQDLLQDAAGQVVEFIGGLKTLRLFDQAAPRLARLEQRFAAIHRVSLGVEAWGGGSIQLYRMCLEAGLVILLLTAAWLAEAGQLSPLAWLLFGLVAFKLLEPLLEAAAFLTELRSMTLGAGRVAALLAQAPLPEGSAILSGAAGVAFDRVGFRYEESWVLRDVSFQAARGTMTAIVGPSGAGKSTVLHLLARFFDPEAGAITIDGLDLRDLSSEQLYRRIGCVFQTVQLFDGTILDNLRIGRPDASEAEVRAACRAAWCDGFLDRLPDGLHTRIGENGQMLSGGERQRLSIARALLRDAPILLLDEATASVDPEAQFEIQQALSRLAADRTVIVVAHRLHTIRHADQILVLDQGRVVERGRHEALLARGGLYATLWSEQAG
jgi:sulfate-transporting ATPase/ATP-binding cassette subfamily B protein